MSRFYANIQGNRGEATRMGTATSGMTGHIRGWEVGCRVEMWADGDDDVCAVYLTSGSNDRYGQRLLGTFRPEDIANPAPDRYDVNAELLAALERHADVDQDTCDCALYDTDAGELCIACATRAAIAKVKGE